MGEKDYAAARAAFRWSDVLDSLGWAEGAAVNLAETMADLHAGSGRLALEWHGESGERAAFSFEDLAEAAARFADVLAGMGVGAGDRVAVVMPRTPETVIAMLGIWRAGAVYLPIFSAFGAEAIAMRLRDAEAAALVIHEDHRATLEALGAGRPTAVVVGGGGGRRGEVGWDAAMAAARADRPAAALARAAPAALLYTSGSTGAPKGVLISTNFPAAITPGLVHCGDLRAEDVFWPTGDPAWGYGMVCYAAALAHGVPVRMWRAQPKPETALAFMARVGVTNLATVPTLLRGIMALGAERVRSFGAPIRRVWSCGEPLNAGVVDFFREVWGTTPLDTYGSSEMGLPVGNMAALEDEVRPGSMGRAFPGHRVAIVDAEGRECAEEEIGLVALAPDPVGFYAVSYWRNPELTRETFGGDWIVTNDLGRRDADGFLWFEGRSDDVIKSAGYRIGPFEVESALLAHPAVAEAGVVGKPDALRGHLVKAYVVLAPGAAAETGLEDSLAEIVRRRLGAHAIPREFAFVEDLPKTESGKIQRFKLRAEAAAEATA